MLKNGIYVLSMLNMTSCSELHFCPISGTRETAFVHALSAAAVAHSVTYACSRGNLNKCGCDRSIKGRSSHGFEWAGCSDNIFYGVAFSQKFVDARERMKGKHMVRGLMNVHNNKAGRIVSIHSCPFKF